MNADSARGRGGEGGEQVTEAIDMGKTATITNIQKFTIHDGPGIRTEVFFKGCPLRCLWCSNPETMEPDPEVGVTAGDCIGIDVCGLCLKACPAGALLAAGNKVAGIDRTLCKRCLRCAGACPNSTLKVYGQKMTVAEVMKVVVEDRSLYKRSGGGVTVSGGDCLMQADFVRELFKACKRAGIHTCAEPELACPTQTLDSILPYTDLVITDIKHMDPVAHRKYTGVSNKLILTNIRYLALKCIPLVIRIPVIPGVNDGEENVTATAEFLRREVGGSLRQLQLLPYRPLGLEKYVALGRTYPMKDHPIPKPEDYLERVRALAARLQSFGIPAVAGTTSPIPQ